MGINSVLRTQHFYKVRQTKHLLGMASILESSPTHFLFHKRIDGADEEPIFDSEFSEYDDKRLTKLSERLKSLRKLLK